MIAWIGGQTAATAALAASYLAVGLGMGVVLARRGQSPATAASALVLWPLLLPLLRIDDAPPLRGPFSSRIQEVFTAFSVTLSDPAASDVPWQAEVESLQADLLAADARVAMVDRLLTEEDGADDAEVVASLDALRAARSHAADEIAAVLAGVTQLRLQIGLVALAGNAAPIAERLAELRGRAAALQEVSAVSGSRR